MKERGLELRDETWEEWQDASLHYDLEQQGLGKRFDTPVITALEHLQQVAAHYQIRENGFRYAPILKFPYRLVFEIVDAVIVVYNIYHTSRRPIAGS